MGAGKGNDTDYGPYDAQEMEGALRRSLATDRLTLGVRLATLVVFYALAARAVADGLPASHLLIPLVFEFVFMLWLGLVISRTVVDCPDFRAANGIGLVPLFWTLAVAGGALIWLAWGEDGLSAARVPDAALQTWQHSIETGLVWAMLAGVIGLTAASAHEIAEWRRTGGAFIWTSTLFATMRILLAIFVLPLVIFLLLPLLIPLITQMIHGELNPAWAVWTVLLVLDLGVVVTGALLHRHLEQKAAQEA
ncbi:MULTISPECIES: hypothetical protein [unclassified Thioalkalivibrio]|uniref:hypothetical protein n=1 Tax=unclassified Thioalkalivibrio TaxID=2621013 RepID=UPI00036A9E6B|nr:MULTISPECIES: hypothetical protein [unclassified Thioalkalivibrio]PYG04011.1 hypothetical protein D893_00559 [Thioalkalivibrio sp. ALE21]